jgi:hypothetical protein
MAYRAGYVSLLLLLSVTFVRQQATEEKRADIYQQVPENQRKLLTETIEKLVAAEKKGDWKSIYELMDRQSGETESKFLKKMNSTRRLREFSPSKVTFMPPDGSWNIQGCALFEGDPKQQGHIADITARWKDSRWYLSPVAFVPFGSEKKASFRDCPMPELKSTSTIWRVGPSAISVPMPGAPGSGVRNLGLGVDSSFLELGDDGTRDQRGQTGRFQLPSIHLINPQIILLTLYLFCAIVLRVWLAPTRQSFPNIPIFTLLQTPPPATPFF